MVLKIVVQVFDFMSNTMNKIYPLSVVDYAVSELINFEVSYLTQKIQ